jgi:Zn-dependent protease/predicted transcriptional regulator
LAIRLGSIYGIPLYLDYTWFIIMALIIYEVGFLTNPRLSFWDSLVLGVLSSLLLLVSIVVHELAHSIIAKRNGLKIRRITMYLLGGVSEMMEEPPNSSLELRMSAAGPLTSLAIAGASYLGWIASLTLAASPIITGTLQYSSYFNLIVAAFNMIPAFPMDGGRVLRSIFWGFNRDIIRSTKIAANVGRIFAYAMMFGGVVLAFLFPDYLFTGLWFVLIGWFISSGAQNEYRQVLIQRDIADIKARDMMTRTIDNVPPDINLNELSYRFMQRKHEGFPVVIGEDILGYVTMRDLRHVKKDLWDTTRVSDIMIPKEKLSTVKSGDSAKQVMSSIGSTQLGRIFVLSDELSGKLVGIITRTDVMRMIQMQQSFQRNAGPQAPEGSERTISVQIGMLFQIIGPSGGGASCYASFNPNEFALVSEQMVQLAPDQATKQFTFQALSRGTYFITLLQAGDKRGIKYIIVVS